MISTKEDSNELADRGGACGSVTWFEYAVHVEGVSEPTSNLCRVLAGLFSGNAAGTRCSRADSPRTLSVSRIDCATANSAMTRYATAFEVDVPSSVGASVPDRAAGKEEGKRGYGSQTAKVTERISMMMLVTKMMSSRICSPKRKRTARSVSRRLSSARCSGPTHLARPTRKRLSIVHRRLHKFPRIRPRAFSLVLDQSDGNEGNKTTGKQDAETGASGGQRDEYSVRQEGE